MSRQDAHLEVLNETDRITAKVTYAWVLGGYVQRVEFGVETTVRDGETSEDALDRIKGVVVEGTYSLSDDVTDIAVAKAAAAKAERAAQAQPGPAIPTIPTASAAVVNQNR